MYVVVCRLSVVGRRMLMAECLVSLSVVVAGSWLLGVGCRVLVIGCWLVVVVAGSWVSGFGCQVLVVGGCSWILGVGCWLSVVVA